MYRVSKVGLGQISEVHHQHQRLLGIRLCVYVHTINGEGEINPSFPGCSSLSLEPNLQNRFPVPHPQHFHLLSLYGSAKGTLHSHHEACAAFTGGFVKG